MQRCTCLLFASLIFCAAVSETFGLMLSAKEKRGWTVNSAGYLLGPKAKVLLLRAEIKNTSLKMTNVTSSKRRQDPPKLTWEKTRKQQDLHTYTRENLRKQIYAIDRVFNDKVGLAGKRDIQLEGNTKAGVFGRPLTDDNVLRTLIDFLTYLHLKEAGVLDDIPSTVSSEETNQS